MENHMILKILLKIFSQKRLKNNFKENQNIWLKKFLINIDQYLNIYKGNLVNSLHGYAK